MSITEPPALVGIGGSAEFSAGVLIADCEIQLRKLVYKLREINVADDGPKLDEVFAAVNNTKIYFVDLVARLQSYRENYAKRGLLVETNAVLKQYGTHLRDYAEAVMDMQNLVDGMVSGDVDWDPDTFDDYADTIRSYHPVTTEDDILLKEKIKMIQARTEKTTDVSTSVIEETIGYIIARDEANDAWRRDRDRVCSKSQD